MIVGQERELDSEILVYFLPDSLEMGEGITELEDISQLKIKSKSLDKAIKKIKLKSIKKAFSDFKVADTLKIRKDGKKIKLANMSRIFKMKLKNKNDVEATIKLLSKEDGVLFAEKNGYAEPNSTTPNDQKFNIQWGLKNGTSEKRYSCYGSLGYLQGNFK